MREYCGLTLNQILLENWNVTEQNVTEHSVTLKCLEGLRNSTLENFLSDLSSLANFNLCDPLKQSDQAEFNRCSMECIDANFSQR